MMCTLSTTFNISIVELSLLAVSLIIFIIFSFFQTKEQKHVGVHTKQIDESCFINPETNVREEFPSIQDEPTLFLSVIIPAFNEEKRLTKMLDEALEFLEDKLKDLNFSYEIIIVSDGSLDKTCDVGMEYSKKFSSQKVRLMNLVKNRGKGGAVKFGMLSSRGKYLLFADADGATKFSEYNKLENEINHLVSNWKNDGIVIGSRAHLQENSIAERTFFRTILMYGFQFLVWLFAVKGIRDTQCGFKLLTRSAGRKIFNTIHVERWAFDVELLYIAQHLKMKVKEVSVSWKEIEGSKIIPFWSWLQMGLDLFLIWFRYSTGIWKIN